MSVAMFVAAGFFFFGGVNSWIKGSKGKGKDVSPLHDAFGTSSFINAGLLFWIGMLL